MNLASAILDVLAAAPPRLRFTFRDGRGTESSDGAGMAGRIAGFARAFSGAGLEHGAVTPILAPSSARLWAAFVGAMAADLIPCILPIPTFKTHMPTYARNLARLLGRYGTTLVLVDGDVAPLFQAASGAMGGLELADLAAFDRPAPGRDPAPRFGDDDVAFLQHSSGSTGVPRGVALSHRAVLGHIAEYAATIRLDPGQDAVASWLPLYHDMGLLTSFLMPLVCGVPCHTLRPQDWILDPPGVLSLISETRATLSWWPNFAFPLLAQRTRRSTRESLDLACLRLLVNCSEPVLARSHDEFRAAFEGCGLRPDVLHASYAMAESVFAVSQSVGSGPRRLVVRRDSIGAGRDVVRCSEGAPVAACVMSSGRLLPSLSARILDEATGATAASPGRVGEIEVAGPSLFPGYYLLPEATTPVLRDGWYRTGDVGFLQDGELFVLGRQSDLIVIAGRKLYPSDVEQAVADVTGVKEGRVVAFGVFKESRGTEELVVLAESALHEDRHQVQRIKREIRSGVLGRVDCAVEHVLILPPSSLIKTSSGKIARRDNRDWFLSRAGV